MMKANEHILSPLRVYSLAKYLGQTSKQLLAQMQSLGYSYTSVHNSVSVQDANAIIAALSSQNDSSEETVLFATETTVPDDLPIEETACLTQKMSVTEFARLFIERLLQIMEFEGDVSLEGQTIHVVSQGSFGLSNFEGFTKAVQQIVQSSVRYQFAHNEELQFSWRQSSTKSSRSLAMEEMAIRLAKVAARQDKVVTLYSLGPHDRRLIHQILADRAEDLSVHTTSSGEGIFRCLNIIPGPMQEVREEPRHRTRPRRQQSYRENPEQKTPQLVEPIANIAEPEVSSVSVEPEVSSVKVPEPEAQAVATDSESVGETEIRNADSREQASGSAEMEQVSPLPKAEDGKEEVPVDEPQTTVENFEVHSSPANDGKSLFFAGMFVGFFLSMLIVLFFAVSI